VLVRATDEVVAAFLGKKQVAAHRRSWKVGEDIEHPSHREGLLKHKPRAAAGALPPGLVGLDQTGVDYFKIFAAGGRSVQRETVRLIFPPRSRSPIRASACALVEQTVGRTPRYFGLAQSPGRRWSEATASTCVTVGNRSPVIAYVNRRKRHHRKSHNYSPLTGGRAGARGLPSALPCQLTSGAR